MAAALRSAIAMVADRIAQILIDVRSVFMAYAPLTHSDAEVRSWVTSYLLPAGETVVAQWDGMVVGVMTTEQDVSCSWITQMAVDPPCVGIGIGSLLLQHAFRKCRLPIRLFTFQANSGARRFYERHGFRPILLSDGQANEERCPDVLYEFTGVGAPRFTTPDRT
jgi:GNAT superfamily N-acetyltransferase